MLSEFIVANRDTIIARTRTAIAARQSPRPTEVELQNGIPMFLDQLGDALRLARSSDVVDHEQLGKSAGEHGHALFEMGLTIRQVVHDYGHVCQTVTDLAVQQNAPLEAAEFQTLNLCLDDAIAAAVTEYQRQHDLGLAAQGTERLGILSHELRNLLNSAVIAFDLIKSGRVAVGGSTGAVLSRSLMALNSLLDLSLTDVRLDAKIDHLDPISVGEFLEEVEIGALLQAQARGLELTVMPVDRDVAIVGDRQTLAAAISNLLQNAFKFTRPHGSVTLSTRLTNGRVFFDVEDQCGGLPPGKADELFRPFEQRGADRSGVGLGLAICRKVAKANAGELHVRDLPGKGCVFTLELPRTPPAPLAVTEPPAAAAAAAGEPGEVAHAGPWS